jgi:RNA recognition motif-containing protein
MGTKLYVGNLNFKTTENTLRAAFEGGGRKVTEVAIVTDKMTGKPRGFAFVRMGTPEDAAAAIQELNGAEIDGRPLRVNEAEDRPPQRGGFGGGGGGRGGYGGGGGGGGRGGYGGGGGGGGGGYGGGRPRGDRDGGGYRDRGGRDEGGYRDERY